MNFGSIDTAGIESRRTYFFSDIEKHFSISRNTLERWRKLGLLRVHTHNRSACIGDWLIDALRNRPRQGQRSHRKNPQPNS